MLTQGELVDLYRRLQEDRVLSIYLDGEAHDPAERTAWRRRLDHHVGELERDLESAPESDLEAFQGALSLLRAELDWYDAFIPDRGWVGFATPDEVLYSEAVAAPMPDLVRWERGIRVAPYIRGLKQERPVFVVLADRRHARFFEYRAGKVEELPGTVADGEVGDLTDVGVAKRGSTHSGVRGQTGADAARRFLDQGTERMIKRLMGEMATRVDGNGFLVVGGPPETVSAIVSQAPGWMADRTLAQPSLHIAMSLAEVKVAAGESASTLTVQIQGKLVDQVVDLARSGGTGCLGPAATEAALLDGRVDALLLSRNYIRQRPDLADRCVGTAFNQGADVEEVSQEPAERLDQEGGGIGARLRFVVSTPDAVEEAGKGEQIESVPE